MLASELDSIEQNLSESFRERSWDDIDRGLVRLAQIAESQGRLELCLRAQAMRNLRNRPESQIGELFQDLMYQVSHLRWVAHSRL